MPALRSRLWVCALSTLWAIGASTAARASTLVGDAIQGQIEFLGFPGINFFDPANGQVPAPPASSGIQPSAVVTEADTTFTELEYTDGVCADCRVNLEVDVDATTLSIREFLIDPMSPAMNLLGWEISLTDLDFGGPGGALPGVALVASDFTGLAVSSTAHSITVSYAGGQDIAAPTTELVATLVITPEPGTAGLLALGILALAARGRSSRSDPPQPGPGHVGSVERAGRTTGRGS